MVFSYSTNAFVEYSLSEAVKLIAQTGFQGVEIMCDRPHLYPPDATKQDLEELKQLLESLNLTITNLNCFTLFAVGNTWLPSWIEPDESRRQERIDHTLNCLDIAHSLGSPCISVPPGGPPVDMSRDASLKLFRQGLEQVIPKAEALGVSILIEPEPDLLIETSSQMSSFIKDFSSPNLGVNFDVGHFYCVGEAPEAALDTLFDKIGHIHIEDIASTRKHHHLIPGLGAIDYDAFFKRLGELNYTKDVCVELYTYTEAPCEAGVKSIETLKPVMEKYGFLV
ncbi:sugar phosphate isomerase/epimerase family protein [uncultured Desulfobacter sp.]|uniref:sugar phosphate isomerase/epimerase family protein n=1 Tax=uncultured Desulfobacter sp. TaxID=240139 RepID=UPI0029C8166C|nr:sugar phosphate isomerase/epimerase family protein [uncultured Desulfobacter sp.]